MTQSTVAFTSLEGSEKAGAYLGQAITEAFDGAPADAVVVFASPRYDAHALLKALKDACRPEIIVGCSSAGEFITRQRGEQSVSAVALRSTDIIFSAGLGRRLREDPGKAAAEIASSFTGLGAEPTRFHSALVLTDALAGHNDDLIDQLNLLTGGSYRFFGGGAGDDARFSETQVFYGTEVVSDAVVALEMLSRKPFGLGVRHGWQPTGRPLRVTEAQGSRLVSLNAAPAVEVFQAHAEATGQHFDPEEPLAFFLHNVLGIDSGGGFRLRVPLVVNEDGSVTCAADIAEGTVVHIMQAHAGAAEDAAADATRDALDQLQGHAPEVALFFDCVATRLRLGEAFGEELEAVAGSLGAANYAGCNTYGQIARAEGQFSGFHNCTAVVCVIPS